MRDAAGREHRRRRDLLDHLRPQDDRCDLAGVPARFGALCDHDVDADLAVLLRVARAARERGDQHAVVVRSVDHVLGRWPERVDQQLGLVLERHVDLRARGAVGPSEQVMPALDVVGQRRDAMVGEHLLDELTVLGRDHVLELFLEVFRMHTFRQLDLGRHHEVDTVGLAVDVLLDPLQLDLELGGTEVQRAEHTHAAGAAHRGNNVAAVAERKDRELHAEVACERRLHGADGKSHGPHLQHVLASRYPPRVPTGTRALETAERKKRCVDVAVELAAVGGYDAVQMRDVAARAEVALGTLYRHYASKDQLLLAAMAQQATTLRERLVARPPRGDTPAERLSDVLQRASRALERQPNVSRAMVTAMTTAGDDTLLIKHEIDATLRAIIGDAMGDVQAHNVDDIVRVLGSVWFAELTYWCTGLSASSAMGSHLSRAASLLLP